MENQTHSLGRRAFLLFFIRRIKLPIVLALLALAVSYSDRWLPVGYAQLDDQIAYVMFLCSIAYIVAVFLITYLEYRVYTYSFTEEAFVLTRGIAMRNEVAALYHQIQNVNINRSPMNRIFGVSEIVIYMTGADRESGHSKIILPAIGKFRAKVVQKELLSRARKHFSREIDGPDR